MSKTKTLNSHLYLMRIKHNALKLRSKYQIPFRLYYLISQLTINSDLEYIRLLIELSELYLRVPNFYKKHFAKSVEVTNEINHILSERGYNV